MIYNLKKVRLKSDMTKVLFVEYAIYKTDVGSVIVKLSDGRHYDLTEVEVVE